MVLLYLRALHTVASEQDLVIPEFLKHPSITKLTFDVTIKTSQIPSKLGSINIWASPVQDGYAVCFNPQAQSVEFMVMSWRSCSSTCSKRMTQHIQQAIMDAKGLLQQEPS